MRNNLYFHSIKRSFSFLLCVSILSGSFSAFGQTRRGGGGAKPPANQTSKASGGKNTGCNGGWSGIVTLTKTLKDSLESDNPGIRKDKDRIKHKKTRDYRYEAKAVIDGKTPPNPTIKTNVNFADKDHNWGEERVWDSCNSRENGHWFIIEGIDNRETFAQATGDAKSFYLGIDEASGTYHFNISFPDANGTYKRTEDVKKSGHCQAKNNEPFKRTTNEATRIKGESFSVYGEKLDPNNPDTITGSKTWGDDGTGQVRSFVYTATWTFTRCPPKLLITELKFEDMKFPNWNDWQEISEYSNTIDGNLIKIKAKVLNMSAETKFAEVYFKETYKGDKYNGSRKDVPLKDETFSIRLEGGEEREVEMLWNSQGYAWFEDGRPRTIQRIKAEVWEEYKLKDEMTKNLKIAPKPLVFVPGIWTNPVDFEIYQNLLTISHSYDWKANRVIDVTSQGTITVEGKTVPTKSNRSVYDNADNLAKYVENVRTANNAWHIDMLAHSTGGLVARLYVHKQMEVLPDSYPVVKHLLMLGTPNNGVPCADSMGNNDVFKNQMQTAKELMPAEIALFNQYVTQRKGTKFAALVGNSIPLLCATPAWNDGFVSVESAKFGINDFAITKAMHPDMISTKTFNDFIKPHLVTGPRGTYPLPVISEAGGVDGRTAEGN